MSSYAILSYLDEYKPTSTAMNGAPALNFTIAPLNFQSLGYENISEYYESGNNALFRSLFKINLKEGANYYIYSSSYFDPFLLSLHDVNGSFIAVDSGTSYGNDTLSYKAPYTGAYYINASWNQGSAAANKFVYLSVLEDLPSGLNLTGTSGDDVFIVGVGNDTVSGGDGVDTVKYNGHSTAYKITPLFTGGDQIFLGFSVTDLNGDYGVDKIYSDTEKIEFQNKTIHIESRDHASYADLPVGLYQFFITAFNAAPGVTYMDQLAEAWKYGLSVKEIVNIFTTKTQFTDVYPSSLDHSQLATALTNNIVKNSASNEAKAEAVLDITASLDNNWSVGDVIYQIFGNLAVKPLDDLKWGNTARLLANEVAVAKYYTETLDQSTTDLATLQSIMAPISEYSDIHSVDAIVQLIGVSLLSS